MWHASRLMAAIGRRIGAVSASRWRERIQRSALIDLLGPRKPDVILANYGQSGVLLGPVAKSLGVPMVVMFHGADASRLASRPEWQERFREVFAQAALVIGPSNYVVDRLVSLGCPSEKARVLRYGIRMRTDNKCAEHVASGRPVRFLSVGRHIPKKHPVGLIRAFHRCVNQLGPGQATLKFIGDGPLFEDVAATVRELGLQDDVFLTGSLGHDAVLKAYDDADIYVQHSVVAPDGDEEGLPVSITEALAAGLPVVATRHSGIPEVVREGVTGYLVEEHDLDAMGRRMANLARQPELCIAMGRNGMDLMRAEFDAPVFRARLRSLLAEAVQSQVGR
jgi:glycosyltransferase involved in cell wall biosynthesis